MPTFFRWWALDLYISIVTELNLGMQNLLLQYSPFKHFKSLKLHFVTLLLSWKLCMSSHLSYSYGWRVDKFSFLSSIISIWSDSLISLLSKLQPNGLLPLNLKSPFTLILKAANVPGHNTKYVKQAGAELGKAQVKLEIM